MGAKKRINLIIAIIIIISIAILILTVYRKVKQEATLQDLRTNLLLIQGKAKTYTEKVSVETANLEETQIQEIKEQKLKGTILEKCDEKIRKAAEKSGIQDTKDYYYLSQEDLNSMGITINVKDDEYYLVKYNFEDTEVVYTKGYEHEGKIYYKLSELKNVELKK